MHVQSAIKTHTMIHWFWKLPYCYNMALGLFRATEHWPHMQIFWWHPPFKISKLSNILSYEKLHAQHYFTCSNFPFLYLHGKHNSILMNIKKSSHPALVKFYCLTALLVHSKIYIKFNCSFTNTVINIWDSLIK